MVSGVFHEVSRKVLRQLQLEVPNGNFAKSMQE